MRYSSLSKIMWLYVIFGSGLGGSCSEPNIAVNHRVQMLIASTAEPKASGVTTKETPEAKSIATKSSPKAWVLNLSSSEISRELGLATLKQCHLKRSYAYHAIRRWCRLSIRK